MNPVVHFEIPYHDAQRAAHFYQQAFGWQTRVFGEEMGHYVVVTTALSDAKPGAPAGAINGGLYPFKADWPQQCPSVVIAVEDIQAGMLRIVNAGGQVLGEPVDIPDVGRYVSFVDTEGNRNSILQPSMA